MKARSSSLTYFALCSAVRIPPPTLPIGWNLQTETFARFAEISPRRGGGRGGEQNLLVARNFWRNFVSLRGVQTNDASTAKSRGRRTFEGGRGHDRRFDNRRELVRGSDTPGGVQLPIGNWGRISAELKFARAGVQSFLSLSLSLSLPLAPYGHSPTLAHRSSLIKPIKPATISDVRSFPPPFYGLRNPAGFFSMLKDGSSSCFLITDLAIRETPRSPPIRASIHHEISRSRGSRENFHLPRPALLPELISLNRKRNDKVARSSLEWERNEAENKLDGRRRRERNETKRNETKVSASCTRDKILNFYWRYRVAMKYKRGCIYRLVMLSICFLFYIVNLKFIVNDARLTLTNLLE